MQNIVAAVQGTWINPITNPNPVYGYSNLLTILCYSRLFRWFDAIRSENYVDRLLSNPISLPDWRCPTCINQNGVYIGEDHGQMDWVCVAWMGLPYRNETGRSVRLRYPSVYSTHHMSPLTMEAPTICEKKSVDVTDSEGEKFTLSSLGDKSMRTLAVITCGSLF
jgi:hypothetical protein